MKLYCVRHGCAMSAEQAAERPLSAQGEQDIQKVARFLQQAQIDLSHILHSSKLRARQTATIIAEQLTAPQVIECESILDEQANVAEMVDMVQSWNEDTMLVGHYPFMPELINLLVLGQNNAFPMINFVPGTVVCLEHGQTGRWAINWVINPNLFSS